VKVNGQYYWVSLLSQLTLSAMKYVVDGNFVFKQL